MQYRGLAGGITLPRCAVRRYTARVASTPARTTSAPADAPPPGGTFAALRVPYYPRLWLSGWLWNMTRWMSVFLCSYLINAFTGSPLLVQLAGTAFFAPMFFGGVLGGVISDRFDRRRTIMHQLAVLTPVAALMGWLVLSGAVRVWMIYPFMLAIGMGGVLDMTSRRALLYDLVGPVRITNAMALESMAQTGGTMLGTLIGGTMINFIGLGQAFMLIAIAYAAAWLAMAGMPSPARESAPLRGTSLRRDVAEGLAYVRRTPAIVSILGVTMLMNFFFFSYMPMVPVFAERLGVNAFWAGVLGSATGAGSICGAFVIAAHVPHRAARGLVYTAGSAVAMVCLLLFTAASWYPLALLALIAAGFGQSGFGALQGALILTASSPEMRGRAMGILSMAIGVLPFGMFLLGLAAQRAGPAVAVAASTTLGLALLLLWWRRHPLLSSLR